MRAFDALVGFLHAAELFKAPAAIFTAVFV